MAGFIPFESTVEVLGQAILTIVNAVEIGKDYRLAILKKYGIENIAADQWYNQEEYLKAFREIAETMGDRTLFAIGKATPENVVFSPQIDTLEKGLQAIDMAYAMHHRGGEIGSYKLTRFDPVKRVAEMVCRNPYPSEFDRGIITTVLGKFRPQDSSHYEVTLDRSKPTRLRDDDSCTYVITW